MDAGARLEFDPVGRQVSKGVADWFPGQREKTSGQRSLRFGIPNAFAGRLRQSFKELAPDMAGAADDLLALALKTHSRPAP